ncbi:desmoglein-2-like protein precursor [Danio rerio]|nr:desmoglein-2-like protein precursor [Danio rerio]
MAKICSISLLVVLSLSILNASASGEQQKKVRQKREWIIPPRKLRENVNYMYLDYIAKIRSDEETRTSIRYSLKGAGADQPPRDLFTVGSTDGKVKINGLLDREKTPVYYLQGVAKFLNGSNAEKDVDLRVVVLDENDCPPVFNLTIGAVSELSARDTLVMSITATDADEEGTLHTKIAYSIVEQSHAEMFYINRETGGIYVMHNTLDREKIDSYTLTVKGTDMNGAPGGNSGTGKVVINILDVNDNVPTLEKNIYECRVEENTRFVEVVRIQAIDADLIYTDNWLAVFTLVSGNEAGYFSITTDKKTNEGILMLNKELDYEELKEIRLQVSVSNKAHYHSSVVITGSKTYTIQVSVINQPEAPRFKPAVKVITISEESTTVILNKVITNYAAIDSDTMLIATNVRYAKGQDVDNWLIIDEKTADIRLNKIPDYESVFLKNYTYYAHILCITNETPAKTATGTIAIQVKDFNDHCPVLIHQSQKLCYEEHVVFVTAEDKDHFPNAHPFGFKVNTKHTKESWSVEHFNDTAAIFRSQETLWPGVYHLSVDVWDQQGKVCGAQLLRVEVCMCGAEKVCLPVTVVSRFGGSGVLLMLLGLLLLLLIPLLLLFCLCGAAGAAGDFKAIPFDAKEHLIAYNTEGQGEDKGMALLHMSKDENTRTNVGTVGGAQKQSDGKDGAVTAGGSHWSTFYHYDQFNNNAYHHHRDRTDGDFMYAQRKDEHSRFENYNAFDGLALSDAFLGNYYSQKSSHVAQKQALGDNLKVYEYEGQESRAGSFEDICSLMHEEEDLAFLDNLDMKFKTLAEICSGSTIQRESINVSSKKTESKDLSVQETSNILQSQEKKSSTILAGSVNQSSNMQQTSQEKKTSTIIAGSINQSSSLQHASTGVYLQEQVMLPNTTLLVQQPALYYAPAAPVYVVEPHPTVLVASGQVLGHQENQKRPKNAKHETHYQSLVYVEQQQPLRESQGSISGAVHMVNTEIMQSTEGHGVRREIRPARRVMMEEVREREVDSLHLRVPMSL